MRLPRMTTRRWMVAMVIVAVALEGTMERRNRFRKITDYHRAESKKLASRLKCFAMTELDWQPIEWHEWMRLKYDRAARYPWLPLEPDPPRPW
jgi:hypothetical protein